MIDQCLANSLIKKQTAILVFYPFVFNGTFRCIESRDYPVIEGD